MQVMEGREGGEDASFSLFATAGCSRRVAQAGDAAGTSPKPLSQSLLGNKRKTAQV